MLSGRQSDLLNFKNFSLTVYEGISNKPKFNAFFSSGVNTFKLLASSKKKLGPLLKKQFFILYFQITGLANDGPSSFFEEPSSVIFEEVKYDLHDGSDS